MRETNQKDTRASHKRGHKENKSKVICRYGLTALFGSGACGENCRFTTVTSLILITALQHFIFVLSVDIEIFPSLR